MGTRVMIFGELQFPPKQGAVWRGLRIDPEAFAWPAFFRGNFRDQTVREIFEACSELNELAGASFFYLTDDGDKVKVRAWLEEEYFDRWSKRVAAAFERAHVLEATGEIMFLGADDRSGIRMTVSGAPHMDSVRLYGHLEDVYARELAEVFELSRGKMFGPSVVFLAAPAASDPMPSEGPLLDGLEFVDDALFVSYRGSLESQELEIRLELESPIPSGSATPFVESIIDAIARGGAGGAHFAPSAGEVEKLDGTWRGAKSKGPSLAFTLGVRGVSPRFLRNVVEILSGVGEVRQLAISGSLALDDTELTVREDRIRTWLSDPTAYLEEWSRPGFVVREAPSRAARVEIVCAESLGIRVRPKLKRVLEGWMPSIAHYVSKAGNAVEPAQVDWKPKIEFDGKHAVAVFKKFPFAKAPARAVLVNLLSRFHDTVTPIRSVTAGLV